ncbi:MAG: hypothetical protein IJO01_06800 [Oscillospiraceae bacterium]|nr:hypothetical protein [Oscillospiraceae bacterium]
MLMDIVSVSPLEILFSFWWPAVIIAVAALAIFAAVIIIKTVRKNRK